MHARDLGSDVACEFGDFGVLVVLEEVGEARVCVFAVVVVLEWYERVVI